jgi:hypothetical protein
LVGVELGGMKLENRIKKAVFLAPKFYGMITDKDEEIIKIKGFKNLSDIHFGAEREI